MLYEEQKICYKMAYLPIRYFQQRLRKTNLKNQKYIWSLFLPQTVADTRKIKTTNFTRHEIFYQIWAFDSPNFQFLHIRYIRICAMCRKFLVKISTEIFSHLLNFMLLKMKWRVRLLIAKFPICKQYLNEELPTLFRC